MTAAWPLPEPDDTPPPRKLTIYHQLVSDGITNAHDRTDATTAHIPAPPTPPRSASRAPDHHSAPSAPDSESCASHQPFYRDPGFFEFLDPDERAPLDVEWPEPEWPDPQWHGFAPDAQDRCTFVLAVSPLLLERYPDKAASLWQVFPIGGERYHDPEPDLEAEP